MELLQQTNKTRFRKDILKPLIEAKLIVMTIPDKPQSSKQKYAITEKGSQLLKEMLLK
jgi:ATP-dependent DNA helicase RecG